MPAGFLSAPRRRRMADWIRVCAVADIDLEDVMRFDHGGRSFAIYRAPRDGFYATDGLCTHEQAHLADGLVKKDVIECPKHNGRFHLADGSPARAPICRGRSKGAESPTSICV